MLSHFWLQCESQKMRFQVRNSYEFIEIPLFQKPNLNFQDSFVDFHASSFIFQTSSFIFNSIFNCLYFDSKFWNSDLTKRYDSFIMDIQTESRQIEYQMNKINFLISMIGSPTSIPSSAHAREIRKLIWFIWSSISSGSHCIIYHWARSLRRTVHPPSCLFLQCTQFLLNENDWKYLSQFCSYFDQNKNRSNLE